MRMARPDGATESAFPLPRHPTAAGQARRTVAATCEGLHRDVTTIAQLLTSEVVTNALQHGAGDIVMHVSRTPGQLLVEVEDESAARPRRLQTSVEDTRGRGLAMLETLASRWGVRERDGGGKTVWFTLRLTS
jgi:anti-sigma regulatory factor (Ser/Thr protein kinase)